MKTLSINECQRDISALDTADRLTSSLQSEIKRLESMDMQSLLKKAAPMLLTGNVSLETLGLPASLFEQFEQLNKLNTVARAKLRARITADLHELQSIEDAEVSNG